MNIPSGCYLLTPTFDLITMLLYLTDLGMNRTRVVILLYCISEKE